MTGEGQTPSQAVDSAAHGLARGGLRAHGGCSAGLVLWGRLALVQLCGSRRGLFAAPEFYSLIQINLSSWENERKENHWPGGAPFLARLVQSAGMSVLSGDPEGGSVPVGMHPPGDRSTRFPGKGSKPMKADEDVCFRKRNVSSVEWEEDKGHRGFLL